MQLQGQKPLLAEGNTATAVALVDIVDSDPPQITTRIFKPARRNVMADMGDITFSCKVGNVAACGKRTPAMRMAGVATVQVASNAALTAYLAKDIVLVSTDRHPCHDDFAKITKAITGPQTSTQVKNRLTSFRVPKVPRDAAIAFASGFLSGGGRCRMRTRTVSDPAGNIDRAVEVVCVPA